jgi:hypothetical protein
MPEHARAEEVAIREDDPLVRLGRTLSGLEAGAKAIRAAVAQASPPGPLRQPLDLIEHEGHWLSRPQVMAAINAASDIEQIVRRLYVRMDPRCKGTLGQRPSWMSPDQYDPCRCTLPRDHEGDHACEHTAVSSPDVSGDPEHPESGPVGPDSPDSLKGIV